MLLINISNLLNRIQGFIPANLSEKVSFRIRGLYVCINSKWFLLLHYLTRVIIPCWKARCIIHSHVFNIPLVPRRSASLRSTYNTDTQTGLPVCCERRCSERTLSDLIKLVKASGHYNLRRTLHINNSKWYAYLGFFKGLCGCNMSLAMECSSLGDVDGSDGASVAL